MVDGFLKTSFNLSGKTIYVAGHRGMVGSALCRRLASEDCQIITNDLDLRVQADVKRWMAAERPDVVVIAAARVGGILANSTAPADFLYDNLMIEANLIHAAHECGAEKLLFLGSSCIYPKEAAQPIGEDALLTGALEPTNEAYALAKIAGVKMCAYYRAQYGRDYISAMPCNLFGAGDRFDEAASHVIPALMMKAHAAKISYQKEIVVWGSGTPLREFLYVDDLADACVFGLKTYSDGRPFNIGSGIEVSIAELAKVICDVVGFAGDLRFDPSKPDGTMRKLMDSSRIHNQGWRPSTSLEDGLARSYAWYLEQNQGRLGQLSA